VYFKQRLEPALRALLKSAVAAGQVRTDIAAEEILGAVASLCTHAYEQGPIRSAHAVNADQRLTLRSRRSRKIKESRSSQYVMSGSPPCNQGSLATTLPFSQT